MPLLTALLRNTLSVLVGIPLVAAAATLVASRIRARSARVVALTGALLQLAMVGHVVRLFVQGGAKVSEQLGPVHVWSLTLDGLAVPLVVLTALLGVVAVLASWQVECLPGAHFALLLALEAAVTLVFLASDLLLFYAAWEAVLVPMYFLIGVWGHEGRRHAAAKFFLYTFAGSALMLVGLIVAMFARGGATGSLVTAMPGAGVPALPDASQTVVFWLVAAGLLVKVPVVPFHTWLPDAHVEAPTAGSIMLAGVLLKMGGYGLIRVALPLAPEAFRAAGPVLAGLGVVGIAYGALMALAQHDLKRLVAYSSVAHMGFVVLAVAVATPLALGAAMLVMVSHGLVAGLLFLLVGQLDERAGTREIGRFGGLATHVPRWATAFTFAALASLGLPGLSGFPGELLTLLEGFRGYGAWMAVVAAGIVLAAAYNLWAVRRVDHGAPAVEWAGMRDVGGRDLAAIAPLALGIVALGLWPGLVLAVTGPAATAIVAAIGGRS